jgi:hypothetical protein
MPEDMFQIKSKDLKRLKKFYKKAPRQFGIAAAGVLNDFAFGIRTAQNDAINRRMVVRNSKFVSSSIRVKKARGTRLNSMHSETGSIRRPRFSGWEEAELGKRSKRKKTATRFGRGGTNKGILKPSFRMKPSARFKKPSDFPGKSQHRKVINMINAMKKKTSRPFIITGTRRFSSGLYKFQNRNIRQIQKFKNRKQPKRIKWHTEAKQEYFRSISIRQVWAKNINRALRF